MDRVLEIGHFAAGYCGRLYVQEGADVVRVEPDDPPPAWSSSRAMDLFLHAGKSRFRSSSPEVLKEHIAAADVVIVEAENAAAVHALGFDDWQVPVKVSITPFGLTGPKKNWRATPSVLLAMGGYTYIMGDPGRAPLSLPGHYVEYQSGQFAYTAANALRLAKDTNRIDLSQLEVVMALSQFTTVMWHCAGRIRERHGSDFWWVVPTNLFRCADGWVYINIVPTFWDALATFLDMPELVIDERFTNNDLRMRNRDALHELMHSRLAQWTKAEIRSRATESRIPAGVVQSLGEVLADPHLAARDFWQTVTDEQGSVKAPSPAWRINNEARLSPALSAVKNK